MELEDGDTFWEPVVDLDPLQEPPAEQVVALEEDQESVVDWPAWIDVGEADNVNVGADGVGVAPGLNVGTSEAEEVK